ncbi:uncharacterized protein LOC135467254 [Liolophura sinensis]|uniref:uncharacterized protein LOC135467254 n=1 Tax=Liolophura sinensis TaxID=3198878 RepID=UPI003158628B
MDMDALDVKVRHFMERFEMMRTNINILLSKHIQGVTANLNNITFGSHSAGAEITIAMMKLNHQGIKASVFLEPMVMYLNTTIPFELPAVMFGTQLSEEGSSILFPPCVFPQYDFTHVYGNWCLQKFKWRPRATGNCDIMDPEGRNMCREMHLCKMVPNADLQSYQLYIQGLTTGFLDWVLHKRQDISYLTNSTLAPIPLMNLKFEGLPG